MQWQTGKADRAGIKGPGAKMADYLVMGVKLSWNNVVLNTLPCVAHLN